MSEFYFCLFVSTIRRNSTAVKENGSLRTSLLISFSAREHDKISSRMLTVKLLRQLQRTVNVQKTLKMFALDNNSEVGGKKTVKDGELTS
jgi:hypothetical protein